MARLSYATTTVDRRAEYHAKAGMTIAADPLDYYARVERGRRWQFVKFQLPYQYARRERLTAECMCGNHNAAGIGLAASDERN